MFLFISLAINCFISVIKSQIKHTTSVAYHTDSFLSIQILKKKKTFQQTHKL